MNPVCRRVVGRDARTAKAIQFAGMIRFIIAAK